MAEPRRSTEAAQFPNAVVFVLPSRRGPIMSVQPVAEPEAGYPASVRFIR